LSARTSRKKNARPAAAASKNEKKKKEKGEKEEKKKAKENKSIAAARYVAHRGASAAARANQITVNSAEKDRPGELIVSFISRLASLVGGEITALARRIDPSSPKYRRTRGGITLRSSKLEDRLPLCPARSSERYSPPRTHFATNEDFPAEFHGTNVSRSSLSFTDKKARSRA